jgi:23S rRNA U2552 (ribose-2'-O)-methylase RlmE/FtsJ
MQASPPVSRAVTRDPSLPYMHKVHKRELRSLIAYRTINIVTSARFIAQEQALVKWSQLRLFKAKEGRSYLQGLVRT